LAGDSTSFTPVPNVEQYYNPFFAYSLPNASPTAYSSYPEVHFMPHAMSSMADQIQTPARSTMSLDCTISLIASARKSLETDM
jgi:hypothetical protein